MRVAAWKGPFPGAGVPTGTPAPHPCNDIDHSPPVGDADEFQIGYPLGHGPVRQTYDDLLSPAIELGQLADAGAVHRFQVFAQFGDPVACESAHAQPLPIH